MSQTHGRVVQVFRFLWGSLHGCVSILVITIATLILSPPLFLICFFNHKKAYFIKKSWCWVILRICGVRLDVQGKENLPSGGAIFLFNHRSFLDIPVVLLVISRFVHFVAKKELEKLPILGLCFKSLGTLMIPRKNTKAALQIYKKAHEKLLNGDNFAIAPEGGRNQNPGISKFKSGPFVFALAGHVDLVPILIKNTSSLWPAKDLLPNLRASTGQVKVKICPKISTKDWTESNRRNKVNELRNFFIKEYNHL